MIKNSEAILSYFFPHIYGGNLTTGELNQKKRIRLVILVVFGSVFAIICTLGVLEMLRSSTMLIDIQRMKEEIKELDDNNTKLIHQKMGLQQDICLRRDFNFIREGQYCIKRDLQRVDHNSATDRCTKWTYDRLLIMDTMEKIEMIRNSFPFDGRMTYLNEYYWVGGVKMDGKWKFPNGTTIPPVFTKETGRHDNNGCLAVAVGSDFLVTTRECTDLLYSICEMLFPSASD